MPESSTLYGVVRFFNAQKQAHHRVFPRTPEGTLIGFLGTTVSGPAPSFGVNRIVELKPTERGRGVELSLEGALPREPGSDENIAACLVDLGRYRGYQVKSAMGTAAQFRKTNGGLMLQAKSVFTVHHSPNVLNVFESIPFEDMHRDLADVRHAVLAVGQRANISPRFIFHFEHDGNQLRLFHGDGLVHKTYLNLRENHAVSYLVDDPDSHRGYRLGGICEEQPRSAKGEGPDRVRAGFAALGFELTKIFVTVVSRVSPVLP